MTNNVIPFTRKPSTVEAEEKGQWGQGPAFCLACNYEWAAVAETGTTELECPECKRCTGHFKFEFMPSGDQLVRECECGGQLFYLTPEGRMRPNCGVYQTY